MMRRFVSNLCASGLRGARKGVVMGLAGLALLAQSANADAQEIQITGPLAGAPAVRKLRLHREGRFEVSVIPNASLRSGMFVRVLVDTGRSCGVAVPRSALLRQNDATSVQVLKDGKVEPRRVVVGLSSEDKVEIRQGLAEGESVVANASLAF